MKNGLLSIATILFISIVFTANASAQQKLPSVKVKNLQNESIDTKDFENGGKPIVVNFWATWCKPCILELNTINDLYDDWQKETGVKIIAISIDDTRNSKRVAPFVQGRRWSYDIYLDENRDFARAMGMNNPPHTFLLNDKLEIVWQHNGYAPGDEDELLEQIKKLNESMKNSE